MWPWLWPQNLGVAHFVPGVCIAEFAFVVHHAPVTRPLHRLCWCQLTTEAVVNRNRSGLLAMTSGSSPNVLASIRANIATMCHLLSRAASLSCHARLKNMQRERHAGFAHLPGFQAPAQDIGTSSTETDKRVVLAVLSNTAAAVLRAHGPCVESSPSIDAKAGFALHRPCPLPRRGRKDCDRRKSRSPPPFPCLWI